MTTPVPKIPAGGKSVRAINLDHSLTSVRRYILAGIATLVLLFGVIGGWAATTDLAGLAKLMVDHDLVLARQEAVLAKL